MDKKELAGFLEEIATLLELKGGNPFKCNAFRNAARAVENLDKPLSAFKSPKDFEQVKGIGKSIAEKIINAVETGRFAYYESVKSSIPSGLVEMLKIPGLGPKKVRAVYDRLGIYTVGELEYACRENRLKDLPGFGIKTQENILEGIELLKRSRGRFHIHEARHVAQVFYDDLVKLPSVTSIAIAGSIRRFKETIKDIDLLVSSSKPEEIISRFVSQSLVNDIILRGETKTSVRLITGISVDLRVVSQEEFPFALMYFTGSKEHNIAMRGRAQKLGFKLNEYGLFERNSTQSIKLKTEEEIFKHLGLDFIPPELREDRGEISAAEKKPLPKLVCLDDLRGVFHIHTNYSDGIPTVEKYIHDAMQRGWQYIGISDHSQSAYYANGLSPDRVKQQIREIDELNSKYKEFRVFKGIESDILPDGALDYPEEILSLFDFVVVSVHSKFKMTEEQMTDRIIRAMRHPRTTMLGHPTGRLLLARDGYDLDMDKIIDAAARNNVVIELNANPFRLDLDWRYIKKAVEKGVLISINPDAHRLGNMDYAELGVGLARKGWCEPRHILNCLNVSEVEKILDRSKSG